MIGGLYYKLLTFLSRFGGLWLFRTGAWFVATGYFLFFPRRVAASMAFYRALMPGRSHGFHRRCAWRQFHRFTGVFADRFLMQTGRDISHTSEGMDHLDAALARGHGAILLMSHVGNWELAAHLLKRRQADHPILLYMGAKQKEQIEKLQKESLAASGIRIVAAGAATATPFDTVEGIQHLKKGGVVSLSGDMVWHPGQRTVPVRFLGRSIRLPAGPHAFALATGAPVFYLFSHRTGPRSHHVSLSAPVWVTSPSRAGREAAIRAGAQAYAARLEAHVRRHPYDWFHFHPLWEDGEDGSDA